MYMTPAVAFPRYESIMFRQRRHSTEYQNPMWSGTNHHCISVKMIFQNIQLLPIKVGKSQLINGHFRNLNWMYLPYIRPM